MRSSANDPTEGFCFIDARGGRYAACQATGGAVFTFLAWAFVTPFLAVDFWAVFEPAAFVTFFSPASPAIEVLFMDARGGRYLACQATGGVFTFLACAFVRPFLAVDFPAVFEPAAFVTFGFVLDPVSDFFAAAVAFFGFPSLDPVDDDFLVRLFVDMRQKERFVPFAYLQGAVHEASDFPAQVTI